MLLSPQEYLEKLQALRKVNKYAKNWKLRLEKKTNRHYACDGYCWGWYEIFPLNIEVGFWGRNKNDLSGVNIEAWNKEAERISQ